MKIDREIYKIGENGISCHTSVKDSDSHWFHWHEKYEICQIINKPCRFLVDGTLVEAAPGDIVAFKERSVHCFLIDQENTCTRILQFPTKALLNVGISLKPLKHHIPLTALESIPNLAKKVNMLFELLEQECKDNQNKEAPLLLTLSSSLYLLLMQHFSAEEGESTITKEQREFYKIVEYVNEHFLEDININTLSEKLFLSRGKLSAIFTKYSGTSLNNYLNSLRIKNANQLLSQGHTITEAALESGFQSIRTFNNVYKKITGITPSDYAGKRY